MTFATHFIFLNTCIRVRKFTSSSDIYSWKHLQGHQCIDNGETRKTMYSIIMISC